MYTTDEQLAAKLDAATRTLPLDDKQKAVSLTGWFAARGSFTEKQRGLGKAILARKRKALQKTKKEEPFWVYAMSDGANIKIGFSKNPRKRITDVQNGNPNQIKILHKWEVVGRNNAKKLEKSLHKHYGKLRKKGEWFCGSIASDLASCKIDNLGNVEWPSIRPSV
jgi:hypothetical protein